MWQTHSNYQSFPIGNPKFYAYEYQNALTTPCLAGKSYLGMVISLCQTNVHIAFESYN